MKPLMYDLFCGLGGATAGFLAEGWDCIGIDIERHEYGDEKYPAELWIRDILTIHGSELKNADFIWASPPCQNFSYMAMPWSRAKAIQADIEADTTGVKRAQLTALFDACFRIQREAIEAAGHFIPMVVENVRGANKWVGRSRWNYGSFHLWGDVPALMPIVRRGVLGDGMKAGDRNSARKTDPAGHEWSTSFASNLADHGIKNSGHRFDPTGNTPHWDAMHGIKRPGMNWSGSDKPGYVAEAFNGTKTRGSSRKAASAQIAKIPFQLSSHIARSWYPVTEAA